LIYVMGRPSIGLAIFGSSLKQEEMEIMTYSRTDILRIKVGTRPNLYRPLLAGRYRPGGDRTETRYPVGLH
jgi:hypothetical protein